MATWMVYLGEAELAPDRDDRVLELVIVRKLAAWCARSLPVTSKSSSTLLNHCRDNGIKLVVCGTLLEVVRTVQAERSRCLSKAQRKLYAPRASSNFISGFTSISGQSLIDKIPSTHGFSFGPSSYPSAQARVVDDYTMSQTIMKEIYQWRSFRDGHCCNWANLQVPLKCAAPGSKIMVAIRGTKVAER